MGTTHRPSRRVPVAPHLPTDTPPPDEPATVGKVLLALVAGSEVITIGRHEGGYSVNALGRDGRRRTSEDDTLTRALLAVAVDPPRRRCNRCAQRLPLGRFSPGDRYCLVCRRELAGERRRKAG